MSEGSRAITGRAGLVGAFLVGAGIAVSLGVYGQVHTPAGRPLFTLGFSGMLPMKAWLATGALLLLVVQLVTALWMWGKLPGRPPNWAGEVHRFSGATAFILTLPVAFHCLWSLGFTTDSTRATLHGVAASAFYGAYATKMLSLRMRGLPGWTLPVLGGTVLGSLVLVWLTSSLWFFTRSGIPLT